jgi:hypothetical protein
MIGLDDGLHKDPRPSIEFNTGGDKLFYPAWKT